MIAADTNVFIAYFSGSHTPQALLLQRYAEAGELTVPPAVVAELLSDQISGEMICPILQGLPLIPQDDGYWFRIGALRATLRAYGLKAQIVDTMIAQNCIDHDLPLLTLDRDFRHFSAYGGLRLIET